MTTTTFTADRAADAVVATAKAALAFDSALVTLDRRFYDGATTVAQTIDTKGATAKAIAAQVSARKAELDESLHTYLFSNESEIGDYARAGRVLLLDGADIAKGRDVMSLVRKVRETVGKGGTKVVDGVIKSADSFKSAIAGLREALDAAAQAAAESADEAAETADEAADEAGESSLFNLLQSAANTTGKALKVLDGPLTEAEFALLTAILDNVSALSAKVGLRESVEA